MPQYLTCVSLRSATGRDQRTIDLLPGDSHIIGRASKSKPGMTPHPSNALFDCAVMSREHAELRVSPSPGSQVTISDLQSLHGTTVNGQRLVPHTKFMLQSGDVIKFGDRVSRGDEAHEGICVTFRNLHHLDGRPESSHSSAPAYNSRAFTVPDDSDHSDLDSEEGGSVRDDTGPLLSADTAPEKTKMGSQYQPIDLDKVTRPPKKILGFLDDDDDEDEEAVFTPAFMPAAPPMSSQTVIPESLKETADQPVLVAEPAPAVTATTTPFLSVQESIPDVDDDVDNEDGDDSVNNNTGLSQILNKPADDHYDHLDGSDEEDAVEYAGLAAEEEIDLCSLDGGAEPSDEEIEDDESENGSSFDRVSQRQASSVELDAPNPPAQKPAWVDEFVTKAVADMPKSPYDPVRASQPSQGSNSFMAPLPQAAPQYTYNSWLYGNAISYPAAVKRDSSRWDISPSFVPQQPAHASNYAPLPSHSTRDSLQNIMSIDEYLDTRMASPILNSPREIATPAIAPANAPDFSRGKLAIGNLLQTSMHNGAYNVQPALAQPIATSVSPGVNSFAAVAPTEPVVAPKLAAESMNTTKRKAADAFDVEDNQIDGPAPKKAATVDVATGTRRVIAVPSRVGSNKQSITRRIAGAAARFTASATFGAAATVAFLNSSYAQRLVEYLS